MPTVISETGNPFELDTKPPTKHGTVIVQGGFRSMSKPKYLPGQIIVVRPHPELIKPTVGQISYVMQQEGGSWVYFFAGASWGVGEDEIVEAL